MNALVTVDQVVGLAAINVANGVFVEPQEDSVDILIDSCRKAALEAGLPGLFRSDFLYAGVSAPSYSGRKEYFRKCWEILGELAPEKLLMELFAERTVMRYYFVKDGEYIARG